jgi:hypothetical protein
LACFSPGRPTGRSPGRAGVAFRECTTLYGAAARECSVRADCKHRCVLVPCTPCTTTRFRSQPRAGPIGGKDKGVVRNSNVDICVAHLTMLLRMVGWRRTLAGSEILVKRSRWAMIGCMTWAGGRPGKPGACRIAGASSGLRKTSAAWRCTRCGIEYDLPLKLCRVLQGNLSDYAMLAVAAHQPQP